MKRLLTTLALAAIFIGAGAQQLPFLTHLYMVGEATPAGWDNQNCLPLSPTTGENGVLTWTGELNAGEFKFILYRGEWMPAYNATTERCPVILGEAMPMVRCNSYDDGDHKFLLTTGGRYSVRVNLADISKPTLTVTKAEKVNVDKVWAEGSALPGGKSELVCVGDNIFEYKGALGRGEVKFSLANGSCVVPVLEDVELQDGGYFRLAADASAKGWNVAVPSKLYVVRLDFSSNILTATVRRLPEELYVVGGATSAGWNARAALPMTRDKFNPAVFTFRGVLRDRKEFDEPTSLKILGQLDWGPYSIHSVSQGQELTQSVTFVENSPADNKWMISSDGWYSITLNVEDMTMQVVYEGPCTEEYPTMLYMIGGATEAGWNLECAIPMLPDENDPAVFTFNGELCYRGENVDPRQFKILGQLWWDPYSIHSTTQDADILQSHSIVIGGDDNKWSVANGYEGFYTIRVNLRNRTISASLRRTAPEAGIDNAAAATPQIAVRSTNGTVIVTATEGTQLRVRLFNLQGRLMADGVGTDRLELGCNLVPGVYVLSVTTPEGTRNLKVSVRN